MAGPLPAIALATGPGAPERVAGAAVLGLVIAVAVAGIWRTIDDSLRPRPIPLTVAGRRALGIAAGALVVVGGSLAGLAWLQVGPLFLAWLVALLAGYTVVSGLVAATPAATLDRRWAAAGVPVALALVALAASPGWPGLTGVVLLIAVLVAARILPRRVHGALQRHDDRAKLTALRFPLMLPEVRGYKVASAYPSGGTLSVSMVRAQAQPGEWGAYDDLAFQVTIGWPGDAYLTAVWARLNAEGRQTGPSQWALTEAAEPPRVIADHGDFLAEAKAYDRRRTPVAALIQAAANLHPVTVDAIMAGRDQPA